MDSQPQNHLGNTDQDEYLNFLDTRPLQGDSNSGISPQAILARSSVHGSNSNLQSVSPASVISPVTHNQQMNSAASQHMVNAGATPQQFLAHSVSSQQLQHQSQEHNQAQSQGHTPTPGPAQAASSQAITPQAILGKTNSFQDVPSANTSSHPGSGFADRTAMFAALQQRQQQQRQKLQMMQQSASRTGSPQDTGIKRSSVEAPLQAPPVGQLPPAQPQGSSPSTNNLPQVQQRQAIQDLDPEVQKRVSTELNNKQFELFMKSLVENCRRRNAPLRSFPEIQGRRVNLFVLYTMVQKLGGGESVTRFQQWPMLTQKLQLATDSSQQLAALYYQLLLPYEQYLASSEGIKETQAKRLFLQQFLQELLKKILSAQSYHSPNNAPTQPAYSHGPTSGALEANKVKKPRKPKVKKKSKKELEREMQLQQEQLKRQQLEQQNKLLLEQRAKQQQEQMLLQQQAIQHNLEYQKLPKVYKRSFARNYVPSNRAIETSNGYDMRAVSQIGEKIDANKPVFLFAPELGTINLHALSLSLLSGCVSEVNVALNTLLVTSADNLLHIPLDRFDGIIESLSILGCQLLNSLCLSDDCPTQNCDKYLRNFDVVRMLDEDTKYTSDNVGLEKLFRAKQAEMGENDVTIKVDSLTGADLEQSSLAPESALVDNALEEHDAKTEGNANNQSPGVADEPATTWHYLPEALSVLDDIDQRKLSISSYMGSLRDVRDEVDSLFSKVTTRGAENYQLMLVDQLSTISMIIRNLSFHEANTSPIATNISYKRFVGDITWALFLHSEKFLFSRKCFNFKKDLIITLSNIAHLFKIEDHVSACLLVLLILSFGEGKKQSEDLNTLQFPEYSLKTSNYQSFGIDVLAKLLTLGYPNRLLFRAVFLQTFELDVQSQDVKNCQKLLNLYEATTGRSHNSLALLHDTFASLVSSIPFQQLNMAPSLVEEVGPQIAQSVTALLSLARICRRESLPKGAPNLPLLWLKSEENLGSSLRRLSEALSNLGMHANNNLKHLKVLFNSISAKCLELVTILIDRSLEISGAGDTNSTAEYEKALKTLNAIPNLLPSEKNSVTFLTNPLANCLVASQMGGLHRLRSRLLEEIDAICSL
ncbi:LADA_0D06194g1_1 [Lachancea dasiensis]|uniref:LADA_0D06194g1_1 n=1 Tax=Lachancea dasiensis TaxID=1072105 RepID=A0A1G4J6J9_9SACH|nr:LADA_0D06194g1_1 [Lachancea dasiensis]